MVACRSAGFRREALIVRTSTDFDNHPAEITPGAG
jgi:hypothetical protein